jgi:hypothetical protein
MHLGGIQLLECGRKRVTGTLCLDGSYIQKSVSQSAHDGVSIYGRLGCRRVPVAPPLNWLVRFGAAVHGKRDASFKAAIVIVIFVKIFKIAPLRSLCCHSTPPPLVEQRYCAQRRLKMK